MSSAMSAASFRGTVPYITAWSSEQETRPPVVLRGAGIGYADETPYDRDADGVLWCRVPSSPGRGRPEFGRVHLMRQRRAMRRMLCQVCGEAADRDEDGTLWLLGSGEEDYLTTSHPPVCAPCAAAALRACPHLRRRYALLRVRTCVPIGVHGMLYRSGGAYPVADVAGGLAYGDSRLPWLRAGQLIVRLEGCTEAPLPRLRPAARGAAVRR